MNRARFPKAIRQYELLNVFGKNIVTTEGDEWKHIRKVVAPAFSEVRGVAEIHNTSSRAHFSRASLQRNNRLVWDETTRIMTELFRIWDKQEDIIYQHGVDLTLPVRFIIV